RRADVHLDRLEHFQTYHASQALDVIGDAGPLLAAQPFRPLGLPCLAAGHPHPQTLLAYDGRRVLWAQQEGEPGRDEVPPQNDVAGDTDAHAIGNGDFSVTPAVGVLGHRVSRIQAPQPAFPVDAGGLSVVAAVAQAFFLGTARTVQRVVKGDTRP